MLAACSLVPEATPPVDTGPDISMQKDEYSLVTLTWFLCSFEDALGAGLGKASGDDPVMEAIRQETGITLQLEGSAMDLSSLNVRMAARELCDITYVPAQREYEDSDIFQPLDVLAEETGSKFFLQTTGMEQVANTAEDGHIYTIKNKFSAEMIV